MPAFEVKLKQFEGPFDLLLDLIEKRKLHINDISLAQVTDDFIAYVEKMEKFSIGGVAHFVLVASTLLLIKSKSLLPNLNLTSEEQTDIHDLEERLKLLQRMRELSINIKNAFGRQMLFGRSENKIIEPIFSPEASITLSGLREAINRAIQNIPIKEFVPQAVVKKIISLEEMIERLVTRVQSSLKMSFNQFTKGEKGEKINIIVGFLAMLELVKQGVIAVNQEKHFGDIDMENLEVGVPRII
ncbi:MAG: ScpA family protein [bacterium]|nr:ScpA family protein [bacterium]